jgi:Immunity protein 22
MGPRRAGALTGVPTVHIFASHGRFASLEALQAFVRPAYSEDGDRLESPFMREVGFTRYEAMCVEVVHSGHAKPLSVMLQDASYSQQWLPGMDISLDADSAVCVFPPNVMDRPEGSSMPWRGAFPYDS